MTELRLHCENIRDEWLDAYGHLNQAQYLIPFSNAGWAFQEHIGVGTAYYEQTGCALFTKESRIRYLREVQAPACLEFTTLVLGFNAKRVHFAQVLRIDGREHTYFECLSVHVDTRQKKSCAFPDQTLTVLEECRLNRLPEWIDEKMHQQVTQLSLGNPLET